MRKIEWIGQPSIFANAHLQARRMRGEVSERELEVLRAAASKRIYRVDGYTVREIRKRDIQNLTRSYQWGFQPGSYIQDMEDGDWRLLQESRARAEFRDVTDGIPVVHEMPSDIQVVKEETFTSVPALLASMRGRAAT